MIRISIFVAYKSLFKMSFKNLTIIKTKDGFDTLFLPELNETYHSTNGAFQEAEHVYLKNGLHIVNKTNIKVLEMGFGTGLNAILTYLEAEKLNLLLDYTTVEAFPIAINLIEKLNFNSFLSLNDYLVFKNLHLIDWNKKHKISSNFSFEKQPIKFDEVSYTEKFDVIYFDAFGYDVQPELWTETIFLKLYNSLNNNGILVTYACRNVIKKAMEKAGFTVKKIMGAPGKREMIQAFKIS